MIIKRKCPNCGKTTDVVDEFKMDTFTLTTFACGHSDVVSVAEQAKGSDIEEFRSADGKKLFPYQCKGVDFLQKSNFRALVADEMGLGKTAQSLVPIALNPEELLPAIAVVKSVAKINWSRESIRWGKVIPQVIGKTKDVIHPMFKLHIFSYDMLTRMMNGKVRKDFDEIRERCKLVIIDETHLIKNPETDRANAVKKLVAGDEFVDGRKFPAIPHVEGLSGTPFKNSAAEYFTILNILHPEKYYRQTQFCSNHVQSVWNGRAWKYGGLKYPDEFKEMTKDYIIRRTMNEVFPELPDVFKMPIFAELEDRVSEIYDSEAAQFAEYYDEHFGDVGFQTNILAMMSRLRHITSLAKIDTTIDKTVEFLGSTDRKLIIFVHHHDTRDILAERLDKVLAELELGKCCVLTANDKNPQSRIDEFEKSDDRIIILSTLSHGESLNLQFMSDSILHERQWNPANEDQAISGRIKRIGQKASHLQCIIPIAVGTIDEFFAELVEQKRQYFESSMSGGEAQPWNETSLMMELAAILAEKGRAKWKI